MKPHHCSPFLLAALLLSATAGLAQVATPSPSPAAAPVASPTAIPVKEDPAAPTPRLGKLSPTGPYWMTRHQEYVDRIKKTSPEIAFFGDSITDWWAMDFKNRYGRYGAGNFGIGGDKTQHLLWRICNGEMEMKPKVAVVLIGTNNLGTDAPDLVAGGITKIVQTIQEKSPDTKVLLLGIFPRGWDKNQFLWFVPRIKKVNDTIAKLDDGKNVRFLDIGPKMSEPDSTITRAVFKDGLHLTSLGYERWAAAMQPLLEEMVGKPLPFIPPAPAATPPAKAEVPAPVAK